ncbi:MAG: helix-turn-helix transcriptional regulator [Clostridia bacterium]|nr:helix-turn-helix transcriptional regulator [Clostridia bacterium]
MIRLGEKIRELRLRDARTQEALACELGVTAQAVSRWEKGTCYPDMEIIPSIANCFGVSIDELFGYDNERMKKAELMAAEIQEMNRQNNGKDINMDECISLAREALIEFPGNEKLMLTLADVLYNAGYVRYGEMHIRGEDGFSVCDTERHKKYTEWQEAIRLYEKLLQSLPEGQERQKAVTELSQLYKNTGEHEKALRLASSAPEMTASRPFLRINAFDGKDAVAASGEALLETFQQSALLMVQIVLADGTIPPEDCAAILQNTQDLFMFICPDGRFGKNAGLLACIQMLRSYYLWLSGERDDAFTELDKALDCARQADTLSEMNGEYYTSPLLHHIRIHAENAQAGVTFRSELPELWPWWDVPGQEKVKAEMRSDPHWEIWVRKAKE